MDSRVEAARRAPTARRRGWLAAIALWSAFLGAALNLLVTLLVVPAHGLDWHVLSLLFLCGWLVMLVPVAMALMLALPLAAGAGDGR
jgi:hypothetical protein